MASHEEPKSTREPERRDSADELIKEADPPPEPADPADLDTALDLKKKQSDLGLRRWVGRGALGVMLVQIAVADAVFVWYGDTNGWDIPASAIHAWLAATVVQVISVVLVITRYLFPPGGDGSQETG